MFVGIFLYLVGGYVVANIINQVMIASKQTDRRRFRHVVAGFFIWPAMVSYYMYRSVLRIAKSNDR